VISQDLTVLSSSAIVFAAAEGNPRPSRSTRRRQIVSVELKPCPHCGSDAAFRIESSELLGGDHPLAGMEYIDCTNKRCGASTIAMYSTGEDCKPLLAERWNRRLDAAIKAAQQQQKPIKEKPVGWLVLRCDGTHEFVFTPLTDDTHIDEGDEAWPLISPNCQAAIDLWRKECPTRIKQPEPMSANGWCYGFTTGYMHVGCKGLWSVKYNDTGLYAECGQCKETRLINPTFPPLLSAQPDGWVSVPREPTAEMLDAAMRREDDEPLSDWGKIVPASHADIYRAMLAAAPKEAR